MLLLHTLVVFLQLPVEWTKYACGQTNDQKQMTERARFFLQIKPRQLSFGDETD